MTCYVCEQPLITETNTFASYQVETGSELSQKKTIAWSIAMAGIEPGCLIFDKLMRGFIWKNYEVKITDIEEELSKICWGCGREAEVREGQNKSKDKSLMACTGCGVAR